MKTTPEKQRKFLLVVFGKKPDGQFTGSVVITTRRRVSFEMIDEAKNQEWPGIDTVCTNLIQLEE